MLFLVIVLIIFLISVIWAYYSLRKERQRHEIEKAKKEMTTGRVIFHASLSDKQEEGDL